MKHFLFFLITSINFCFAQKQDTANSKTILFIGNSLTYINNMPSILDSIFRAQNIKVEIVEATYSGITLQQHLSRKILANNSDNSKNAILIPLSSNTDTSTTIKLIYSKKWDYIVLQEGTVRLLIPEVRSFLVIPTIKKIKYLSENYCKSFILFKTWPSLDSFPKHYCYPKNLIDSSIEKNLCCSDTLNSLLEEFDYINKSFEQVSSATGLPTIPITECYKDIYLNYPKINLYQDNMHPSIIAAYMNACIFYKYLTKNSAHSIKYTAGINADVIKIIHTVIDKHL